MTAPDQGGLGLDDLGQYALLITAEGLIKGLSTSTRLLGYLPSRLTGRPVSQLLAESAGWEQVAARAWRSGPAPVRALLPFTTAAGLRQLDCTIWAAGSGDTAMLIVAGWDVTGREQRIRRLEHCALRDEVTGAYSAAFFLDQLHRETHRDTCRGSGLAVLFLSVEGLIPLAEQHGGCAGERLLVEYRARMSRTLRRSDVLSRFGASQFTLLCPDLAGTPGQRAGQTSTGPEQPTTPGSRYDGPAAASAARAAGRLSRACAAPLSLTAAGPLVRAPLVIGWALAAGAGHTDSGLSLLAAAEAAMRIAQSGPARPDGNRIYPARPTG